MHWRGDWTDHRVSPDVSENRNISWSSRESNITLPRPYPSHYTYWYSDSKLYQYTNLHVSRESLPNQMFAGSARLLTPIIRQQIVRRWIGPPQWKNVHTKFRWKSVKLFIILNMCELHTSCAFHGLAFLWCSGPIKITDHSYFCNISRLCITSQGQHNKVQACNSP